MPESDKRSSDPTQVACEIARHVEAAGCEYALGGAIALGYWASPRGTLDVDITLYLAPQQPSACIRFLQKLGCDLVADVVTRSIREHGFCQVEFKGRRIDVFLPIVPFYDEAKSRRRTVVLNEQPITIWDAETLCVFKMMFFRRKDLADVEQILRVQRSRLDINWITQQITQIFGVRDPRVSQWKELVREVIPNE